MSSVWTIRRSATDAKLAGLCGGIARYWGIDPVLVRVGAVLLVLSGGVGLVLYVAGWLLVPADGRATSILYDAAGPSVRKWPREAWVVIVAVACLLVFAGFGFATPFGFGPAVVLALIWYFGYYKNRSAKPDRSGRSASPPAPPPTAVPPVSRPAEFRYPGPATPFTEAAEAWRQRMAEVSVQRGSVLPPAAPAPGSRPAASPSPFPLYADAPMGTDAKLADPPSSEAAERAAFLAVPDPAGLYADPVREAAVAPSRAVLARTRSARRLRLVSLVVLGLTLAGLGLADSLGSPVTPAIYLAAALLVVGLTLVAATWFGRARGILPVGVLLLVALLSVTAVSVPSQVSGLGRSVTYTGSAGLPTGCDELEVGTLTVDLSRLDVRSPARYCAHVDGGRLDVIAPAGANVVIEYTVDAGVVFENGQPRFSGTELAGSIPPPVPNAARPTLTLDLSLNVGELRVQR